ncbi:uncharacterized protein LOC143913693 [Arctopsyche grandis]|uniref:uncharacterized protein LOC143913693 n=1 Tax=Arctopsyche grandis TaxID=121162 RepID=UPI00406D79A4
MFDAEKFITEVQKRPSTWDSRSRDYNSNREKKSKDWKDIAEIMYPQWATMSSEDKQIKGKELMAKWKNIKDNFRRQLKENNTGITVKRKRPYIYYELLQFLRPVIEEGNSSNGQPWDNEDIDTDAREENVTNDLISGTSADVTTVVNRPTKQRRKRKFNNTGKAVKSTDNQEKPPEDEDKMFFLSLVSLTKHMPIHAKLKTRIEIMTVIQKNLYQDLSTSLFAANNCPTGPLDLLSYSQRIEEALRHQHPSTSYETDISKRKLPNQPVEPQSPSSDSNNTDESEIVFE